MTIRYTDVFMKNENRTAAIATDYAAVITGSAFADDNYFLKFDDDDKYKTHCYIVKCRIRATVSNGISDEKQVEELTHDMIKCATIISCGNAYTGLNTTATSLTKYLVVFNDGRQAIITSIVAEYQFMIENILF